MKNSNDTIENRTRDLPACSAVPQPTAPPRDPNRKNSAGKLGFLRKLSAVWARAISKLY